MATTSSIVTAVDNSLYNNFLADDGAVSRIRDGQVAICTAFGNLAIPVGATIDGIVIYIEGYAGDANHDTRVGDWISVSNDGGSTMSTAQSVTSEPWSTNSGAHAVEKAGGVSELWGMSWDVTTAAAIQVKLEWSTSGGDAVYIDYVNVEIYYTPLPDAKTYPSDENFNLKNGTLELKNGTTTIR
jgi:hypothetical protein